ELSDDPGRAERRSKPRGTPARAVRPHRHGNARLRPLRRSRRSDGGTRVADRHPHLPVLQPPRPGAPPPPARPTDATGPSRGARGLPLQVGVELVELAFDLLAHRTA